MTRAYLEQDCPMTMREALDDYFASFDERIDPDTLDDAVGETFRQHDAAHVVFGTDTSLLGESLTDTWSFFGSSLTLREGLEYFDNPELTKIVKDIGMWKFLWAALLGLPTMFRALWRARRMNKQWPWTEWRRYLDRPLRDIRDEFGIRVVKLPPAKNGGSSAPMPMPS